jgi:hypothetical protein
MPTFVTSDSAGWVNFISVQTAAGEREREREEGMGETEDEATGRGVSPCL